MTASSSPSMGNRRLGDLAARVIGVSALVGVIGVIVSFFIAPAGDSGTERFYRSYLMAFMFVLSICLGALFFTILQHCVKAGWSVAIRRIAESIASNLMWIWILFIPVWNGMRSGHLYEWVHPGDDHLLLHKVPYLNPTFWTIRAVVFFGIWAFLAWFYHSNSVAQDSTGDVRLTRRMEKLAPVAVGLYFISQAFASMDWVMSLEARWFSTMFPVYFFAASCCGYFAVQILVMYFLQRNGLLRSEITREHYQDAGKLLFAFGIIFWAYIAYSQYMLIWYANIPEETPFYLARQLGGWLPITILLLLGHFLAPFLGIMSRHPKRAPALLVAAASWMLFMHAIDIYWLTMPHVPRALEYIGEPVEGTLPLQRPYHMLSAAVTNPDGPEAKEIQASHAAKFKPGDFETGYGFSLLDLTCILGLGGLVIASTAWRMSGASLIPERDPRLHESLAFENT